MATVSICIPTYNQTKYLVNTLDSIANQSYHDYEIIISDDSNNSDVKNLVDRYNFSGKLKYYHNSVALGSPKNWNAAIAKANGEYIKILHHDDWFTTSESLKILVNEIEKKNISFVFPNSEQISDKIGNIGIHRAEDKDFTLLNKNPNILFQRNFVGSPSMTLYKKDETITFDENLKWLVDVDFYIRYLTKHSGIHRIDKSLVSILTDSENTVTAECINNKQVEIYENFYLYHKIKSTLGFIETFRVFLFLIQITNRFRVLSINELKLIGAITSIPLSFIILFYLDKPIRLTKKTIRFLKRRLTL